MSLNEGQKRERWEYLEENLEITECSQRKPYVFISYASDNWETVFKSAVVPLQKKYGLRVYADKAFDKVNDKWIVPMLRNIRGSDVMMVFVSQSYIESYACFLELLTAVNNKKQIVFVSLEEQLHLGDTTDQPNIERGVKNEILNQGENIATNTNNTSNDIMRAMKSAYTSLSTLLEQDALAKYDISDAFINFFRDASINRKTIHNLEAIRSTIHSVSRDVFEQSLVSRKEGPDRVPEFPEEELSVSPADGQPEVPTESEIPRQVSEKHGGAGSHWTGRKLLKDRIGKWKPWVGACVAGLMVLIWVIASFSGGHPETVTDVAYTLCTGVSGTYTGEWKNGRPRGQGTIYLENGGVYEGEWKDGEANGQGTVKWSSGAFYEGEWKDSQRNGQGTMVYETGDRYEGEWVDDKRNGQGTFTYSDGRIQTGLWEDGKLIE